MATWKVSGADRDTDARVEIELSAPDEASALLAALLRGVYAAHIRRVRGPDAPAPARSPVGASRRAAGARPAAADPDGQAAARKPAPPPDTPKTPARGPAPDAAPNAAPTTAQAVGTPATVAEAPQPIRVSAVPRRVQVRRAPPDLLPRALADAIYSLQPPADVSGPPHSGQRPGVARRS